MCDCYSHKCHLCDEVLPVHIADFCTPRENIEVYCSRHLPRNVSDFPGGVWKWDKADSDCGIRRGTKWGILIKDTTGISDDDVMSGICPNTCEGEPIKTHQRRDKPIAREWEKEY